MKNIILIGFMGTGKTTVGKELARIKDMDFLDMDLELEKKEKKTINQIFNEHGEVYFREKESELLKEISCLENTIISTGGGVVENESNAEILKNIKNVIWLDGNVNTIANNLENEIDKRPKLKNINDLKNYIQELLNYRYEKYRKCSDIKINIDDKNIAQVVREILVYI
ncbi:MAG: shikimate kinase [Paraclostridium bifermentans]